VAIGLLAEARIAARLGLLSPGDITVIADALTTYGLPIRVTFPLPFERVAELMKADKKSVGGSLRLALPRGIGVAVYDVEVPLEEVALVLGSIGER
jgi:3-dehydroquinate synthetase